MTINDDGVPAALGRDVRFIKGSTYDTLAPFLADRPAAPIRLFHMDLDTYESCLHALETCKDHFVVGSILVFDEYLVTNGEMRAFYDFQKRYELNGNTGPGARDDRNERRDGHLTMEALAVFHCRDPRVFAPWGRPLPLGVLP